MLSDKSVQVTCIPGVNRVDTPVSIEPDNLYATICIHSKWLLINSMQMVAVIMVNPPQAEAIFII